MCIFNLVLFALVCQEVLSGFPKLASFVDSAPTKPQTWEQAGKELELQAVTLATLPGGARPTEIDSQERPIRNGWWYAQQRLIRFQWNKAETTLKEKLKDIKTRPKYAAVKSIHGFVGITLRIDGTPPTREEADAAITAGELPPSITLLWSNGNAEPKQIKLDDTDRSTQEQTARLKSAISASKQEILDLIDFPGVQQIIQRQKALLKRQKETRMTRAKAEEIKATIRRLEVFKGRKMDKLGLVMYIEGATDVQYSFIHIQRVFKPSRRSPFRSREPSFFFVQDIEKKIQGVTQSEGPQPPVPRKELKASPNQQELERLQAIEHHVKAYESRATGPAATASATSSKTGHGGSPPHRAVEEPSYERYPARNDPYDNSNYAGDDMNVSAIVMVVAIYVLCLYCLCVCCSVIGMPAGCYLAEKVNANVQMCEV